MSGDVAVAAEGRGVGVSVGGVLVGGCGGPAVLELEFEPMLSWLVMVVVLVWVMVLPPDPTVERSPTSSVGFKKVRGASREYCDSHQADR